MQTTVVLRALHELRIDEAANTEWAFLRAPEHVTIFWHWLQSIFIQSHKGSGKGQRVKGSGTVQEAERLFCLTKRNVCAPHMCPTRVCAFTCVPHTKATRLHPPLQGSMEREVGRVWTTPPAHRSPWRGRGHLPLPKPTVSHFQYHVWEGTVANQTWQFGKATTKKFAQRHDDQIDRMLRI